MRNFDKQTDKLRKLHEKLEFTRKEIRLFRAISQYLNQISSDIDLSSIQNLFLEDLEFTKSIRDYFLTKFSPYIPDEVRKKEIEELDKRLEKSSSDYPYLITIAVLKNMVRTNYFLDKESIAFKIEVKNFHHLLNGLQPNYEIFVYNPYFMGLHLRKTKVSRGGLRWSEREDFREEIKSLMITQDGKNSIIVPAGAKGGFVLFYKREELTKELFTDYYSKFINNLLDLVDNKIDGKLFINPAIVRYDGDDTYFVVAADKGTASMSDVANSIAISRNFWLKDGFASGGSNGYSHKDLGITAKGAFVSTERFFLERGIDIYKEPITVIGIGSMNGDVFGNGILLSRKFRLLGAISHKEIFIDPNPDCEISYQERKRLFNSKNGSWSQYDKKLISKGGGVFRRDDKSIPISPEMKEVFNISEDTLSADELIQKLLTAKVDLLFNGGVGTYVKASTETNEEVGDLANAPVRVDGKDIQAFAVCEGGNLGFTQKGRVEYSLNGGKINLDAIDNSAGVNISDHEVNIKILLSMLDISNQKRNELLKSATDEVVELVLTFNYNQALGISLDEERAKEDISLFVEVTDYLERNIPDFSRQEFAIPPSDNFTLSRPNIAFLFSYSKILITKILLDEQSSSNLVDSHLAMDFLINYFPKSLQNFRKEILHHPLSREIVATLIADRVVNNQGVTFLKHLIDGNPEEFIQTIYRYLSIEELVQADRVRERLGRSCQYQKYINFEKRLIKLSKEINEFLRSLDV